MASIKTLYPLLDVPKKAYLDIDNNELYLFFQKGQFIRYSIIDNLETITYRSDYNLQVSDYYIDTASRSITIFFDKQVIIIFNSIKWIFQLKIDDQTGNELKLNNKRYYIP